jgi:hypothetical protein
MFRKADIANSTLLLFVTFLLWLPTRDLPYWWDSAGFVVQSAYRFLDTNFFPLTSEFTDFAHPTLFIVLLALLWKIFGESLLISHIYSLVFTALAVTGMYAVGKEIFPGKHRRIMSFLGGMLLLFSPIFLAQVGIIYMEIPLAALALWSYYFFLKQRFISYTVTASLMVLMKETGVLFVIVLFVVHLISQWRKRKRNSLRLNEFVYLLLPVGILAAWFLYHWYSTGWWLVSPAAEHTRITSIAVGWSNVISTFTFTFVEQWRFILLVLPGGLLFYFATQVTNIKNKLRKMWTHEKLPLLLIPALGAVFFAKTTFLPRYSILILPFFYLSVLYLCSSISEQLFLKWKTLSVVIPTILLLIAFASAWNNHTKYTRFVFSKLENNLEYMDIIAAGKKLSAYMQKHHADSVLYSSFPVNYMLTQPGQHYVTQPVTVKECKEYKQGERLDGIIIHLYSPGQLQCTALLQKQRLRKYVVFEENNKRFVLFTK